MSKGSASQASTLVPRGGGGAAGARAGPVSAAGLRSRAPRAGGGVSRIQQSMMQFYADDSPGIRISPVTVLLMSLVYILLVTVLHIYGKFRG